MKILKVPMRNYSTLIYFVNGYQSEEISDNDNLVDDNINSFLATIPENDDNLPSDLVIGNILNFARSYEVYETEEAGIRGNEFELKKTRCLIYRHLVFFHNF
jgi:hypothetical protein